MTVSENARYSRHPPWPTTTTSRSTATSRSSPASSSEVRPGVRRVLCNNPSPFTFTGTVSYIVGTGKVAIIDPGPDDEAHAAALLDAVRGETVTHILVTHTHRDHSPNTARIKAATGAHRLCRGAASRLAAALREREAQSGIRRRPRLQARHRGQERRHHRRRRLGAGSGGDAGPHRQSSGVRLARAKDQFRRRSRDGLVDLDRGAAGWIDDRLHGVAGRGWRRATRICISPVTGRKFRKRQRYVRFLTRHRQAREASILHRLAKGEADIPTMVRAIYIGIDPRLTHCGRLFGAGASGRPGRARRGRDRRRSGDRRELSAGVISDVIPGRREARTRNLSEDFPGLRQEAHPGMTRPATLSSSHSSPAPWPAPAVSSPPAWPGRRPS